MLPTIPILIAVAAGFVGLVAFWCGLIGLPSLARPTCRPCGTDVRPVAWDDAPRCPRCAADLTLRRAIRWRGRRRARGAIGVGLLLMAMAGAIGGLDMWLAVRGLMWRDMRPISLEIADLRNPGAARAASDSVARRDRAGRLAPADRRAAIEALLSLSAGAVGPRNAVPYLASDPSLAGSGGTAEWGPILEQIAGPPRLGTVEVVDDPEAGQALRFTAGAGTAIGTLLARIRLESVRVGGQELLSVPRREILDGQPFLVRLPPGTKDAMPIEVVWERILLPLDADQLMELLRLSSDSELTAAGIAHSAQRITSTGTLGSVGSLGVGEGGAP